MRFALCVVLSAALSVEARAQSTRATVNQFADWYSATSTMKFTDRFNLYVDLQSRYAGTEGMQHQFRVSGDFITSSRFSFSPLGYVYIWNSQYGKQPMTYVNNEHRIYQQFTYKHKMGGTIAQHRIRTEERFIQYHAKDPTGEVVDHGYINKQLRVRYRASFQVPLTHQESRASLSIDAKSWYLFLYDELFVSWGEMVTYHEIDQNRIFVGAGYQFTKDFTIQSGFFYQMLVKANGAQQENNIGIGTWLIYNFDFRKQ